MPFLCLLNRLLYLLCKVYKIIFKMYNNSVFRREKEEAPAKVDGGIFGLLQYRRVPGK